MFSSLLLESYNFWFYASDFEILHVRLYFSTYSSKTSRSPQTKHLQTKNRQKAF
jgi:hypothetical protein